MKYSKMVSKLNVENEILTKDKIELEENVRSMKLEIEDLTKKNKNLHDLFSIFYMSQQKLNDMLETRRAFFDKDGLGYNHEKKETHFKNFFVNANDSSSIYAHCNKLGPFVLTCSSKKVTYRGKLIRKVWIPKGISTSENEEAKMKWIPKRTKIMTTNTQGPIIVWVPKKVCLCFL
ncbi:hypothetical protein PTKIN_Ptkin16aG0058400 [Pterospermum kingtungense]